MSPGSQSVNSWITALSEGETRPAAAADSEPNQERQNASSLALRVSLACQCGLRCGLLLVSFGFTGCGSPPPDNLPKLSKVTGSVTYDGKPLPDALVTFVPDSSRPSSGKTDESGNFTLMFNDKLEGAAVGKHKVTIMTPMVPSSPTSLPPPRIPAKYNVNSELTEEVKSGDNVIDFTLTSS
jgi:hypothetical protein